MTTPSNIGLGVLIVVAIAAAGVWVGRQDWRELLRRVPGNGRSSLRAGLGFAGIGALIAAPAALAWRYALQTPDMENSALFLLLPVAGTATFLGLGFIAFGMVVFVVELFRGSAPNSTLELVAAQKTYETGGYAADAKIHLGLLGGIKTDPANGQTFDE